MFTSNFAHRLESKWVTPLKGSPKTCRPSNKILVILKSWGAPVIKNRSENIIVLLFLLFTMKIVGGSQQLKYRPKKFIDLLFLLFTERKKGDSFRAAFPCAFSHFLDVFISHDTFFCPLLSLRPGPKLSPLHIIRAQCYRIFLPLFRTPTRRRVYPHRRPPPSDAFL